MKILLTLFSIFIYSVGLIAQDKSVDNKGSITPIETSKWQLNANDIYNKAPATKVGIGITTPLAELHINGDLRVETLNDVVSYDWIFVDATTNVLSKELVRIGDIKYGFQTADHQGWFLLDGRAIATLTSYQQDYAAALGFVGNLPNANNKYLVQNAGALGATIGNTSVALLQTNLPNYTMNVAFNTTGDHSHTYTRWTGGQRPRGNGNRVIGSYNYTATTGAAGNHSHTFSVPSGGNGTAISLTPQSMSVHTFIFLGTL